MSQSEREPRNGVGSSGGSHGAFKRRGFQIFGLGLQDFIRFFFGGNASLAIIILILICVFLAKEAFMFFPQHHEGLKAYRLSGQEYVDYVGDEVQAHTNLYSAANIAYFAEVNHTSQEEDSILRAYRTVLARVENETAKTWGRFERDLKALKSLEKNLSKVKSKAEKGDEEAAQEVAELEAEKARLEGALPGFREKLKKEVAEVLDGSEIWNLGPETELPPEDLLPIFTEAIKFEASPEADDPHEFIAELKATSRAKKAEAAKEYVEYKQTLTDLRNAIKPLKSFHGDLKKIAVENKRTIESFASSANRRKALLAGAEKAEDPAEKARMLEKADAVVVEAPDYAAMVEPLYESVSTHNELVAPLGKTVSDLVSQLPTKTVTQSARDNLKRAEVFEERFRDLVNENRVKVEEWSHETPLTYRQSVTAFLTGKKWTTNSPWHDFYGLLPIFTGSLLISIIALIVTVPFSVSAAVFVNQLASRREQNVVKPAIEFIGAIPSVVLGFFGILVFGETLRAISQIEALAWIPGFPMAERLTILNAGLLLAFMAVPTIFTLTEDALNNVPKALTENSLALGASKLQTVFRVVVPTAASGIIAAILLGFGRVIGETMVVLLVAGNKIKVPDFTEGIGVVAQPAHTMTGIIAQELAEVDSGSLHWRALFMVGMVLFVISLVVNFSAQRILKRFQKF